MAHYFHALVGAFLLSLPVYGESSPPAQQHPSSPTEQSAESAEHAAQPLSDAPRTDQPSDASDNPTPAHQPVSEDSTSLPPSKALPRQQSYRSVSESGQVIVSGKDYDLVSAISSKAETIRKDLTRTLGYNEKWKHIISIQLHGSPGSPSPTNPVRLGINIVSNQPTYIIHLHVGRGIELENLYGAVTTMLLYEMMLREIDLEGIPEKILLPPWILLGLEQAILWKADMADRNLYASLFERGEILSPSDILSEKDPLKNLDATSYAAFKASCGALVLCLLNQEDGKASMLSILREAILGSDDPVNLVKRNFPNLNLTSTSLHKWWTLQLSTMATPPITETMSILLTEQRLEEALKLIQFNKDTKKSAQLTLDNLEQALLLPDLDKQLRNVVSNLIYLGTRSFPTYKPIIVEYSKIIALIQLGKTPPDQLKKRLQYVATLRQDCVKAATRSRDYLDWFEITNKNRISNTFDSYMETMKLLRNRQDSADTPLSRYLKDIEVLYTLPAMAPTPAMKD